MVRPKVFVNVSEKATRSSLVIIPSWSTSIKLNVSYTSRVSSAVKLFEWFDEIGACEMDDEFYMMVQKVAKSMLGFSRPKVISKLVRWLWTRIHFFSKPVPLQFQLHSRHSLRHFHSFKLKNPKRF